VRPVVDELDLHVGAELAGGHRRVALTRDAQHGVVERAAERRRRGAREARAVAARGVGRQRELADQQQAAAHVLHAAVHLAGVVGEDAQLQQLVDQFAGL